MSNTPSGLLLLPNHSSMPLISSKSRGDVYPPEPMCHTAVHRHRCKIVVYDIYLFHCFMVRGIIVESDLYKHFSTNP